MPPGKLIEVICNQSDCVYHNPSAQQGKVYCSHGEKEFYMNRNPCPLYRMDWQKKGGGEMSVQGGAAQFLKLVKRPGR